MLRGFLSYDGAAEMISDQVMMWLLMIKKKSTEVLCILLLSFFFWTLGGFGCVVFTFLGVRSVWKLKHEDGNFLDQSDGYYCVVEQSCCTLRIYI